MGRVDDAGVPQSVDLESLILVVAGLCPLVDFSPITSIGACVWLVSDGFSCPEISFLLIRAGLLWDRYKPCTHRPQTTHRDISVSLSAIISFA